MTVTATDVRRAAMDLLARREHSRQELHQKLLRRFMAKPVDADTIIETLDKLAAQNLQSDTRFCEVFCHHRSQQGYGPTRIAQQLRQRGVDDGLIESTLRALNCQWDEIIAHIWQKKFRGTPPKDYNERSKHARYLNYRGFTHGQIKEFFNRL